MADELGLTHSAYSKIETGKTDPSVGRITQIAEILKVDVIYFFQEGSPNRVENHDKSYGVATKSDIEELTQMINKIKQEIASLKAGLPKPQVKKKKKA